MGDRSKLPKWASDELALLEMRLEEARQSREAAITANGWTRYQLVRGELDVQWLTPTRPTALVVFPVDIDHDGRRIERRFEVSLKDDVLTVRTSGSGTAAMAVRPIVSNTIELAFLHDGPQA